MAETFNFEKPMARLGEIVAKLESGDGSLEEAMKLFEEGAKLSSQCYEALRNAEQKITELSELGQEGKEDGVE